jgi:hypothetical protein
MIAATANNCHLRNRLFLQSYFFLSNSIHDRNHLMIETYQNKPKTAEFHVF